MAAAREAIEKSGRPASAIAAIGITNQRETAIVWDRATGRPIHNAIVWQDRRTAPLCRELVAEGLDEHVRATTGLLIDAYFSATKLKWLLDNVPGARSPGEAGRARLRHRRQLPPLAADRGRVHATDASNACRTMLFDITRQDWDDRLLERLDIPRAMLPEVRDNSGRFGETEPISLLGAAIPITGMAGDQQAATFGQACFQPGMLKSTYGTGCFALLNTGERLVPSKNRLLSTIAWRLDGKPTYAIEGSIFIAGAAVQWVRDGLRAIAHAAESEALARTVPDCGGVYLVPAFTGLGAPWWDPDARGAILGITRDSTGAHIVRAALEAVCLPDRRPDDRDEGRHPGRRCRRLPRGAPGRWRHGRQRLGLPVPRRHPRLPGRAPGGARDHGIGRRLSRRARHRLLSLARRDQPKLAGRWPLHALDAGRDPRRPPRRLGRGRGGCASANQRAGEPPGGRRAEIVTLVQRQGFVTIEALAQQFEVTPQTIRRDINELAEEGVLQRHHGGAALPSSVQNIAYSSRQVLHLEAKQRIARAVARSVPDNASLSINIGTTNEEIAKALMRHEGLSVITNNLNVANIMAANEASR
jgi:DNA-binding transcriptional regulator YhcF (GntR family)